ncbi:hypothetical protein [Halomarina litorea]|uniref:hypothetical protein n=1 Tax=Halomarina litorea TaxID=2961595 RepID=UPI0020C50F04|nr:hypothetical protein [Halomarina sp. BCD28]
MAGTVVLYQGQSALLAGFAGLFALATAELLAAMVVAAVASSASDRTGVRVLPERFRAARDRFAPRPLDAFLAAGLALVAVELLRSRTAVAVTLAVLCLGTFGVAAVLFGTFSEDGVDDCQGTESCEGGCGDGTDEGASGVATPSTGD